MSLLERQLAVWARQLQDHQRLQQTYATIESHAMPHFQSSINNDLVYREMKNRSMNADQYFDSILPEFGDCRLAGTEFAGDTISIASLNLASGSSLDMDHSFSLNSVALTVEKNGGSASTENTASMIGGRNLKKRKAELLVAEDSKDEEIGGESEVTAKSNRETSTDPAYIHVRAGRGQATDSHSLAERARRERIDKKMKCLQDLVPGCSKVTGKAGMLEEIINYVQSLQRQVEFLSMKLATLNSRIDFDIDSFIMKEFPAYVTGFPAAAAPFELANLAYLQFNQGRQGATGCGIDMPINPTQIVSQTNLSSSMSIPKVFLDSPSCFPHAQAQAHPLSTWETDLHKIGNAGFH